MTHSLNTDIADLFKEWCFQVETYECNLDFVRDQALELAEFYHWEGSWENLREQAYFELEVWDETNTRLIELLTLLKQALEEYETYDASLGMGDITEAEAKKLYDLEYLLVKELLGFFDDPEMFVIAHILDTVYPHSEVWLVFDRYEGKEALERLKPYKLKMLSA
jgi:hypothetical protein